MVTFCPQAIDWGDIATWVGAIGAFVAVAGSAGVAYWLAHRETVQARKREIEAATTRLKNISALVRAAEDMLFLLTSAVREPGWVTRIAMNYCYQIKLLRSTLEPLPMGLPSQLAIAHLLHLLSRMFSLESRLDSAGSWNLDVRHKFAEDAEMSMKLAELLREEIDSCLPEQDRKQGTKTSNKKADH